VGKPSSYVHSLEDLGWSPYFEASYNAIQHSGQLLPARIAVEHKSRYVLYTTQGEYWGELSGKYRHAISAFVAEHPAVGDWVLIQIMEEDHAIIHDLLPRRTKFSRKAAGAEKREQIAASNIDIVFLVMGMDENYNLRRLERYLVAAWDSGANPIIVLSKADLAYNLDEQIEEVKLISFGVPVIPTSIYDEACWLNVRSHITKGKTAVLLGSSGAGKSSIVNQIAGRELQLTQHVSESNTKGKHTTTHRELFLLDGGGLIMDTPGMRELQLWSDDGGLSESFEDVEALFSECRFRDCSHQSEPGCAVQIALREGALDYSRWQSYEKLQRELAYAERRKDPNAMKALREEWKKRTMEYRRRDSNQKKR